MEDEMNENICLHRSKHNNRYSSDTVNEDKYSRLNG